MAVHQGRKKARGRGLYPQASKWRAVPDCAVPGGRHAAPVSVAWPSGSARL